MQNKPVELSAVQQLKYKMISRYVGLFTRMALHSCVHCSLLIKQNKKTDSLWIWNDLPLPVTHNKALIKDVSKVTCWRGNPKKKMW